jgi:hypothetical protein
MKSLLRMCVATGLLVSSMALAQEQPNPASEPKAASVPEGEVLRVKLEWLNAKECGIDGCKPQAFVLRSGGAVGFQWPEMPERGLFQVRAVAVDDAVKIEIKRTWKEKNETPEQTASFEKLLAYEAPAEVSVGELRWLVTVAKVPPKAK